jgi:2-dehydro-3-deoxygluconokinase
MQTHTFDIVAMGEAMVEFNQTTPGQPNYLQGFGGDTSNAIIAAARAGARCAYVTAVGDDSFGHDLLNLWRAEQVNIAQAAMDTVAPTGIYFVTHGAAGHEFSYHRAGSAAAVMALNDTQRAAIASTKILHLSGISLAISSHARVQCLEAIRIAKAAGAQISFDSNLRLKLWSLEVARAAMLPVIAQSDIFLPSLDDVIALSGLREPQAIVDWCHQLGAQAVFLKLGTEGVLVSHGGERTHVPAHAVQAVDATGAGDCFAGNLLARLCAGDSILTAACYANAAAALSVQGFGAVAPQPKPKEVFQLLNG